ncbi:MAG: tetratricopeptide repeat protein [Planctomycetaceae bacterium]|nr:tetratricopeptide repeat protein [Planctomycetaceae bacterium]
MPKQTKNIIVVSIYLALIAITLAVFWQTRNFDFVTYDDGDYVYENDYVLIGLTPDNVVWAFTTGESANWHPLTWLSLMADVELFGPRPGPMHLVNLLFHIANTLLLFALIKRFTGSLWPSAFVAAAFAIHPMHVESVAWISERKDVLSCLLFLLTLTAYANYVNRPSALRYIAIIIIYILGLMAKPMLVTVPFVLMLLDYWPLDRVRWQKSDLKLILEKIPFFAFAFASGITTFLVQQNGGAVADIEQVALGSRIANAFVSYITYIEKMFWPTNLAVFYPLQTDISFYQTAVCILLFATIFFTVLWFGRKHKYLITGWLWFVITLIPVIGIVQVGLQACADRYTYIPYIGLFIMFTFSAKEYIAQRPKLKNVAVVLAAAVLIALGTITHKQTGYWSNGITLFSQTLNVTKENYVAYNCLGVAYDRVDRLDNAINAYQQAIKINPDYCTAYYNLGITYRTLGRFEEAVAANELAIKIKPNYPQAYNNLGISLGKLGRFQEAANAYQQSIRLKPNYADAYCNFGNIYLKIGQFPQAIEFYKKALSIQPNYAKAHFVLGTIYLNTGDKNSAMGEYTILQNLNTELANQLLSLINNIH